MADPIWKAYADAACTQELANSLDLLHYTDGSEGPQDVVFYWAEVISDVADNSIHEGKVRSDPGVANFTFTPTDVTPGSEHEVTEIKLATTLAGLDTATAGQALALGTVLTSGLSGKKEVHMRVTNAYLVRSTRTDLSLAYPEILITDVE